MDLFLFLQIDLVKHKNALHSGVLAKVTFNEQAHRYLESAALESLKKHMHTLANSRRGQPGVVYSLVSRVL